MNKRRNEHPTQMGLADWTQPTTPSCVRARWRKRDPQTSRAAAAGVEAKGRAHSHRTQVLAAVHMQPGSTYRELAAICSLDPVEVMRRLNDLELAGAVRKIGEKRCPVGGRLMSKWSPRI